LDLIIEKEDKYKIKYQHLIKNYFLFYENCLYLITAEAEAGIKADLTRKLI